MDEGFTRFYVMVRALPNCIRTFAANCPSTRIQFLNFLYVKPGTAASSAPTIPPAMQKVATVCQTVLPLTVCTTSHTSANTHSPIGNPTSIGCTGYLLILAGLDIDFSFS